MLPSVTFVTCELTQNVGPILSTDVEFQQLCRFFLWTFVLYLLLADFFIFNHISHDNEFLMAVRNSIDCQSLNFYQFFYDSRFLLNSEDLDPDVNYNIPFVDSHYKLPSELTCQVNRKSVWIFKSFIPTAVFVYIILINYSPSSHCHLKIFLLLLP